MAVGKYFRRQVLIPVAGAAAAGGFAGFFAGRSAVSSEQKQPFGLKQLEQLVADFFADQTGQPVHDAFLQGDLLVHLVYSLVRSQDGSYNKAFYVEPLGLVKKVYVSSEGDVALLLNPLYGSPKEAVAAYSDFALDALGRHTDFPKEFKSTVVQPRQSVPAFEFNMNTYPKPYAPKKVYDELLGAHLSEAPASPSYRKKLGESTYTSRALYSSDGIPVEFYYDTSVVIDLSAFRMPVQPSPSGLKPSAV